MSGEQTVWIEGIEVKYEWAEDGQLEVGLASLERLVEASIAANDNDAWNLVWDEVNG